MAAIVSGVTSPPSWTRANFLAGEWREARRGARFRVPAGTDEAAWPQSESEDLAAARAASDAAAGWWAGLPRAERRSGLGRLARRLEQDEHLWAHVAARFALEPRELERHRCGLVEELSALDEAPPAEARGRVWLAPDWRELLRAPLLDLARACVAGRTAVLLSDPLWPELGEAFARAAAGSELPPGTLGVLHGARRELIGQALEGARPEETPLLVASALTAQVAELRRAAGPHEARLRALRCGVFEVDPARSLADSAAEAVERAFGRGSTLCGQLSGALGRVFCPARSFSRFSELLLAELARLTTAGLPPQADEAAVARARAAWELGLDEGATCIAGGQFEDVGRTLEPTVFTNVESFMESARRADPLPVLCLLRG